MSESTVIPAAPPDKAGPDRRGSRADVTGHRKRARLVVRTEASRDLQVLGGLIEVTIKQAREFLRRHPRECPCGFCASPLTKAQWFREDAAGLRWLLNILSGCVGGNLIHPLRIPAKQSVAVNLRMLADLSEADGGTLASSWRKLTELEPEADTPTIVGVTP